MGTQLFAQKYLARNLVVFPVGLSYDKERSVKENKVKKHLALEKGWTGFILQSVESFSFTKNSLGLLTGPESAVMALDIDNMDLWNTILTTLNKTEPETCRCISQSGGRHLIFKITPELERVRKKAVFGLKALGIDDFNVLGKGDFLLIPPSSFMTPNGLREYKFLEGYSLLDNPDRLTEAPEWLIDVLTPGSTKYMRVRESYMKQMLGVGLDVGKVGPKVGKRKVVDARPRVKRATGPKKVKVENEGDGKGLEGDGEGLEGDGEGLLGDGEGLLGDGDPEDWTEMAVTQKRSVALCRVQNQVFKLDPTRAYAYDTCRNVGFSIHSATRGSKGGFQIFCEFSALCPTKYDHTACRKFWDNCADSDEGIRFGSLVKWAEDDTNKDRKFDFIHAAPVESFEQLQPILEADFGCCGITSYWEIMRGYQFEVTGKRKCFICGGKKKTENMVFEVKQPMPAIFSVRGTTHPCKTLFYGLEVHKHFKDLVTEPTADVTFSDLVIAMTKGGLKYSEGQWLIFNGHRWHPKQRDHVYQYIQFHCRRIIELLQGCINAKVFELQKIPLPDEKIAKELDTFVTYASQLQRAHKYCGSHNSLKTIRENLQSNLHEPDLWGGMDSNAYLMCAENGVIDLKTGRIRDGHPSDQISMSIGYDFVTDEPRPKREVDDFVGKIYPVQAERDLAQKWFGYCLLGQHYERVMCLLTDVRGGSNGKTTMVDAVRYAMGEYAIRGHNELIYVSNSSCDAHAHQSGWAPYRGKRMVVFEELERRRRLDTALLKDYNSASKRMVKYRPAGLKDEVEYPWRGKFVFLFNEDRFPSIDTTDEAFTERLMLIPHRSKFVSELPDLKDPSLDPEDKEHIHLRDPDIMTKIQGPWRPYILQWCLEGLRRYFAKKFTMRPASSNEWLAEITMGQDGVKELVKTHWVYTGDQKKHVKQGDIWRLYDQMDNGTTKMKKKAFLKYLKRKVMKGFREYKKVDGVLIRDAYWGWECRQEDGMTEE